MLGWLAGSSFRRAIMAWKILPGVAARPAVPVNMLQGNIARRPCEFFQKAVNDYMVELI
jgi:hypothetical protein